jgi:hydroxymethylpyrimidine/phosphomethylpyrimidine kinase
LTIAGSDSGGGAGIQADLKAFAAAGCFGTSAIVALTAQNTLGVTAVEEMPPSFIDAQLEAVFSDIGVDAAKTGMLFSRELIDTVADFLCVHRVPLVVDPVMLASSGAKLLQDDAVEVLVDRLFPLATVVTPNLMEADALAGSGTRREVAERIHELGASAVIVTGGHGEDAIDGTSRSRSSGTTSQRRTGPGVPTRRPLQRCSRRAYPSKLPHVEPRELRPRPSATAWSRSAPGKVR